MNKPQTRWIVLAVSTLAMFGFYGAEFSFGVLIKPIIDEFGWSRAAAAGAMSMVIGVSGPAGVVAGRVADKYGSRMVIAVGSLLAVLGYLLMSGAESLWQLYLYFGVFLGLALSAYWAPFIATVSKGFSRERVLAIGILTSGLTMGSMLVPPLTAQFIQVYSWRTSFLMLALIVTVAALPALFVLRKDFREPPNQSDPDSRAQKPSLDETRKSSGTGEWSAARAVLTLAFGVLVIVGFVTAAGFFFLAVHIVALATDLGIALSSAALILSFQSLGNITGKLMAWPITNRIGSRNTLVFMLGLQTLSMFSLTFTRGLGTFFVLTAIYGLGLGVSNTIRMSMIPQFFGTAVVGTLVGIAGIAWGLGGTVGPVLAGYIFDMTRSYDAAFIVGGLLLTTGTVASLFLRPPKVRVYASSSR